MNWQRNSIRRLKIILGAAILLVIVATFSVCSVLSLIDGTKIIFNTGSVSTMIITSPSGSPNDIQTSVNVVIASGGGTVYIPAGDWQCNQTPTGAVNINLASLASSARLNIIGSYNNVTTTTNYGQTRTMPATILRSAYRNDGSSYGVYTFYVTGAANKHLRISGLSILGLASDSTNDAGIFLYQVDGYRIDHCYIDSNPSGDILTWMSKGLIDHCSIDQTYHFNMTASWGYGIAVVGDSQLSKIYSPGTASWIYNLTDVLGRYDWNYTSLQVTDPDRGITTPTSRIVPYTAGPIYIEDNVFNNNRHAVSAAQYGFYVARYNVFQTPLSSAMPYCDIHGYGFPAGRGAEIYNNTFYNGWAVDYRGGGGVVFNNTFTSCPTSIGISSDGGTINDVQNVHDLWIWSNAYISTPNSIYFVSSLNYTGGVDYFSDVPATTNPAPPRLGYAPYPYPHPLTIG